MRVVDEPEYLRKLDDLAEEAYRAKVRGEDWERTLTERLEELVYGGPLTDFTWPVAALRFSESEWPRIDLYDFDSPSEAAIALGLAVMREDVEWTLRFMEGEGEREVAIT